MRFIALLAIEQKQFQRLCDYWSATTKFALLRASRKSEDETKSIAIACSSSFLKPTPSREDKVRAVALFPVEQARGQRLCHRSRKTEMVYESRRARAARSTRSLRDFGYTGRGQATNDGPAPPPPSNTTGTTSGDSAVATDSTTANSRDIHAAGSSPAVATGSAPDDATTASPRARDVHAAGSSQAVATGSAPAHACT